MNATKSPFLIYPNFISPLMCRNIIKDSEVIQEDDGLCAIKPKYDITQMMTEKIQAITEYIMNHYDVVITDMTNPLIYELKQDSTNPPQCDNSKHLNGKWVQMFPRDISCYIALCTYNDNIPFDESFEVYGGKYEFPQHEFGFNPQMGTLILHPSGPHFIHQHTPMEYGNLFYIQFYIKTETPFIYNPKEYPGDYTTWFREIG